MPTSFAALGIVLVAVLPGALYTWSFERQVGTWKLSTGDRALRFVASSVVFAAFYAYPASDIWRHYLHVAVRSSGHTTTYINRISDGAQLPLRIYAIPLVYIAVPVLVGTFAGEIVLRARRPGASRFTRLASLVVAGRAPAPRAWDEIFFDRRFLVLRVQLKDGRWIGGLFARRSYASGYPEKPTDLLLQEGYRLRADGTFVPGESPGGYDSTGSAVFVAGDEIVFMELFGY